MTTEELERDLRSLAEPQAEDEHLRLAIRGTLGEHLQVRPRRRRRSRVVLGSASVAAATLAAAIIALVGTGGSGGPSSANAAVLAHVARTLSPPADMIVHVKEVGVLPDGTQVDVEWWQETIAPYALRLIKGPVGHEGEAASDGTTTSQYDAGTDTIYRQADSQTPRLIDPIESVRAALANGTAQVAGTVTIDGRSLYKIELPDGVVGYFDKSDYQPVYLDNPQGSGSVVRTRVTAYEELALTPENEKLLSISAQHPGARVQSGAAPAPTKQPTETK
jgi:hypothetical protein